MKCPFCNTENPKGAAFCKHCGKSLTEGVTICPSCSAPCKPNALFCPGCGTKLKDKSDAPMPEAEANEVPTPENGANEAPMPETETQETQHVAPMPEDEALQAQQEQAPKRRGIDEEKQKKLSFASGVLMMGAVLLSLIFVFFIGVDYRVGSGSYNYETYTVWHYFGRAYAMLESDLAGHGYSAYTIAANYIPTILSTIVAVAALGATVAFSLVASVKFGLHCKRGEGNYFKPAVAAVFSFMLGATLFDCIHATSSGIQSVSVSLSDTTIAGMVFCCFLIIASLVLRTVSIGNRFKKKQAVLDCVCTLIGILFLAMTSGSANAAQADYSISGSNYSSSSIGFFQLTNLLSLLYNANTSVSADFVATFTFSLLAILAQLAVQVLAFLLLIGRIGNYTQKRDFTLKLSIALASTAVAYLTFSIIGIESANGVIAEKYSELTQLWIASAPIMTFVSSLLHLTVAIVHKVVTQKGPGDDEEPDKENDKPVEEEATI